MSFQLELPAQLELLQLLSFQFVHVMFAEFVMLDHVSLDGNKHHVQSNIQIRHKYSRSSIEQSIESANVYL
jgi:hypothetical protein